MKRSPTLRQRGITLLESLVAIVVAAVGILGILNMQMRTLADTQTSMRRAQAIRLIEDLGERMKVNPNAMANLGSYVGGWSNTLPTIDRDCSSTTCSGAELAAYDLAEWKRAVQRSLPLGDANVFRAKGESVDANRRQLGVMLRWRENEKSTAADYTANINAATGSGDVRCGEGYTCHLQYIPVSARCAPYQGGSAARYFCPGS